MTSVAASAGSTDAVGRAGDAGSDPYRTLFDATDQGCCVIEVLFDEQGRASDYVFRDVNAAFTAQSGIADAVGRRMREIAPAHEAYWFELYGRVARTGEPAQFSAPADALGRHFEAHAVRVGRPGERLVAVLFADVTRAREQAAERERLLAAAEAARADAERANEAKGEFLAVMSHEIRTPINAIQGYAQLLDLELAGPVTPAQRGYLQRLNASARHLLGLVDDVLDLAKVDAGELRVAREARHTGAAVAAAVDLVRPQAAQRGVSLVDAGAGAPGEMYVGDEHRVRQILVNLVGNAVKFTEAGGTVTVRSRRADREPPGSALQGGGPWAVVDVADTGVGIAPEQIADVFDPFRQVERGHTRRAGGTGLGLTISRRLAQLMGGDVTVESEPGAGSTFSMWLPAAGDAETPKARGMRATGELRVPARGVGELGELLRAELEAVLEAYDAQLRADPQAPHARRMSRTALEDHLLAFVGDLAQSLVIVGEAGEAAPALLSDSSRINAAIAQAHGERRHSQGWSAAELARDYAVLSDVLRRVLRDRVGPAGATAAAEDAALGALLRQVEASAATAGRAWEAAAQRAPAEPSAADT